MTLYMPSNAEEAETFHARWCEHCQHDNVMNGTVDREGREFNDDDLCQFLSLSFAGEFIAEWIENESGIPVCTQFVRVENEHDARN